MAPNQEKPHTTPLHSLIYSIYISVVGTCQNELNDLPGHATTRHLSRDRGRGKKGATHHFSKCSLIKDYFKKLISHNIHGKLAPFLTAVSKFAYLLSTSCEKRKCVLYSDPRLLKTHQNDPPFSVGYRQHIFTTESTAAVPLLLFSAVK